MPKLVELDARQRKACMVKAKLPCAMSSINRSAMKLPRVLESLVRTIDNSTIVTSTFVPIAVSTVITER
jgi:hypothetical protein